MNENRIDSRHIKIHNRGMVFEYILKNHIVSKQDLVTGLHLSLPTVTTNLNALVELGLVEGAHSIKYTGGRNAKGFAVVANARRAIGINMTAHHMNAVSVNLLGEVGAVRRERIAFDMNSEAYLREIGRLVDEIMEEDEISEEQLLGVGIGVPGIVSDEGDVVIEGTLPGLKGKTKRQITKYLHHPATLFYDAYAAGYAEMRVNEKLGNAFYLGLSNTIYGALIWNHQIYSGDNLHAGDMAHMILYPNSDKVCSCGNRGCFNCYCSASELDSLTDGNLAAFFALLEQRDEEATRRFEAYLDSLALAIHNLRS
ncbi:MAG: ROK family protein, partial [Blautia sp.]|nr:ROK family protein [Blautia sp.]